MDGVNPGVLGTLCHLASLCIPLPPHPAPHTSPGCLTSGPGVSLTWKSQPTPTQRTL